MPLNHGDINRTAMGRALGVNTAHISRICSGQAQPSLELARRMAEYLGVTLDELSHLLQAGEEKRWKQSNLGT
jgi:transcriptional regulator with XRE-family HTH domain